MAKDLLSDSKIKAAKPKEKAMSQLRVAWGAPAPHANMF